MRIIIASFLIFVMILLVTAVPLGAQPSFPQSPPQAPLSLAGLIIMTVLSAIYGYKRLRKW